MGTMKKMSNTIELKIGEKFGKLTILSRIGSRTNNIGRKGIYWLCKCDCGNVVEINGSRLKSGDNKSCGCLRTKVQKENLRKGRTTRGACLIEWSTLIGKRFERLLIISYVGIKGNDHLFKCKCDCGNIIETRWQGLRTGSTKSCGCYRKERSRQSLKGQTWSRKAKGVGGFNAIKLRYKNNAKKRNLNFELNDIQLKSLLTSNCYYCGRVPSQRATTSKENMTEEGLKNSEFIYNGIDRLDNTKGYFEDNCVPCCHPCNVMKMELSEKDFLQKIKLIYEKHIKDHNN